MILISKMIAIQSFYLLFLEWKQGRYVLWINLFVGWAIVIAFVVAGPATLNQAQRGPFCTFLCHVTFLLISIFVM